MSHTRLCSARPRHTLIFTVTLDAQSPRTPPKTPVTQAQVDRITRDAILIDTHDDVPSRPSTATTSPPPTKPARPISPA